VELRQQGKDSQVGPQALPSKVDQVEEVLGLSALIQQPATLGRLVALASTSPSAGPLHPEHMLLATMPSLVVAVAVATTRLVVQVEVSAGAQAQALGPLSLAR
jgi:hypothetical protein